MFSFPLRQTCEGMYVPTPLPGGARGVVVIVVG